VSAGWASVLIAAAALIAGTFVAILRVLIKGARLEEQLTGLIADVAELTRAVRDDKRVTDQRIFWLERRTGRGRG
jgi:hypothetical protein